MHSDFSFVSAELYELSYGYEFLWEEETPQWCELPVQFLCLDTNIDLRWCLSYTSRQLAIHVLNLSLFVLVKKSFFHPQRGETAHPSAPFY